jgi:hypothetical protein
MSIGPPVTPERTQARLAARLLVETQLTSLVRAIAIVRKLAGGSFVFDRGIFFLAILRASGDALADWPDAPRNGATGGGISINALSQSLHRPFETVRRHVNALIDAGLCARTSSGVVVPASLREDQDVGALLVHLHDSLVWLVDEFHAFDMPLPHTAAIGHAYRADITLAASIDLALGAFDNVGLFVMDWLELAIVGAVLVASVRRITLDSELARRYSETATFVPLERREPVSAAAIARALTIPYSTVRRQILVTVAAGKLIERGRGVVLSDDMLAGPGAAIMGATATIRTAALFGRLVPGGFPFHDPKSAYAAGPPALVDFT